MCSPRCRLSGVLTVRLHLLASAALMICAQSVKQDQWKIIYPEAYMTTVMWLDSWNANEILYRKLYGRASGIIGRVDYWNQHLCSRSRKLFATEDIQLRSTTWPLKTDTSSKCIEFRGARERQFQIPSTRRLCFCSTVCSPTIMSGYWHLITEPWVSNVVIEISCSIAASAITFYFISFSLHIGRSRLRCLVRQLPRKHLLQEARHVQFG